VTVTITLHNDAPAGLPAYVVARGDAHFDAVKPGDDRLILMYLATRGATFTSSTLDGKRAPVAVAGEQGHPVFYYDLELPRGASRTIVLHLDEPAGKGTVTVLPQPLVRPLAVSVDDASC
jgi:hypothetical protein